MEDYTQVLSYLKIFLGGTPMDMYIHIKLYSAEIVFTFQIGFFQLLNLAELKCNRELFIRNKI